MIGSQLEELLETGSREILLVAPFVKVAALTRLVNVIRHDVELCCVTRWLPEEIASGVSDLEVWPLLKERRRASLRIHANLHAKYYRVDDRCLVGSANVTGRALGWVRPANLELLVPMPRSTPGLPEFEALLLGESLEADQDIYDRTREAAQLLEGHPTPPTPQSPNENDEVEVDNEPLVSQPRVWMPSLRNPKDLFLAYSGGMSRLSEASRIAAATDLARLMIAPNLPEQPFLACVGALLLQQPIVAQIDAMVAVPQRFGAVRDFLASRLGRNDPDFDATRAWQTLMRWLRYFLTDRYGLSVPHHSEVFYRLSALERQSKASERQ